MKLEIGHSRSSQTNCIFQLMKVDNFPTWFGPHVSFHGAYVRPCSVKPPISFLVHTWVETPGASTFHQTYQTFGANSHVSGQKAIKMSLQNVPISDDLQPVSKASSLVLN